MYILDRIEGDWAIIESPDGMWQLPTVLLPQEVKEGDILHIEISVSRQETDNRKETIEEKAHRLFD